jgi:hypothetical protein
MNQARAMEDYMNHYREIVELCEDYWHLLRIESFLFNVFPKTMFGSSRTGNHLYFEIKRSFIMQMVCVSVLGVLVSNQDFRFKEPHLEAMSLCSHKSFINFMQLICAKLGP